MSNFILRFLLLVGVTLTIGSTAFAHRLGEGYLVLNVVDDQIHGRVELHLEDVENALHLDTDADGVVSAEELDAGIETLKAYVVGRVRLGTDEQWWPLTLTTYKIANFPFGQFVQISFVVEEQGPVPDNLRIEYRIFFDHDENQRGLLVIEKNDRIGFENTGETVSLLFDPESAIQELDLTVVPTRSVFALFVREGVWHIWIGIDHILFLVALLLPSVRDRSQPEWSQREWKPVGRFRPALWSVVKVVTLFTVAHSITLALAALRIFELPGPLVETIIAASIVAAATDNIVPIFGGKTGWIVFGFGLFHGLGFASVLSHLTLSQASLLTTLLGFNLGVEIGQVGIICVVFPVLFLLRKAPFYPWLIQRGFSVFLILIGVCWMIERTFDVTILGI